MTEKRKYKNRIRARKYLIILDMNNTHEITRKDIIMKSSLLFPEYFCFAEIKDDNNKYYQIYMEFKNPKVQCSITKNFPDSEVAIVNQQKNREKMISYVKGEAFSENSTCLFFYESHQN